MTINQIDFFGADIQGVYDADGHCWFGKYKVITACGITLDYSQRKNPYKPKLASKHCELCGQLFYYDECKHGKKGKPLCGNACSSKNANKKRAEKMLVDRYLSNPLDRCFNCGVLFRPKKSKHYEGNTITCSIACGSQFLAWCYRVANPWRYAEFSKVAFKNCLGCDKLFVARGNDKCCSNDCKESNKKRANQNGRKKRRALGLDADRRGRHRNRCKKYNKKYINGITLRKLVERDGNKCATCQCRVYISDKYRKDQASIGHIVALSDQSDVGMSYGHHVWENVMVQCVACNSSQGVKSFGQPSLFALAS